MITPVSYLQWDSRWKNVSYTSTGNKSQTIGNSGCGTTCAAMVVASLKNKKITPVEASAWAKAHGYRTANSGTSYAYFEPYLKQYGITCKQTTLGNLRELSATKSKPYKDNLVEALKAGKWAICAMGTGTWTKSGHYILAYGIDASGKVLIRDPNSTAANRTKGNLNTFLAEIKHIFIVETGGETKVAGIDQNEWMKCYNQMRHERQDNDASSWSEDARKWAIENGIVQGGSDDEFNGMWEDELTREQMVVMLFRFTKFLGKA